jgi:tRNA A37 threonylcarbamoyladenosine modification protein TsaB
MAILVIDLSYQTGSVFAFSQQGQFLGKMDRTEFKSLPADLQAFVKTLKDPLVAIAIPSGPGAFTPLRVGASTALAMAVVKNIPIIAYPSFLGALCDGEKSGKIFLDARSSLAFEIEFSKDPTNKVIFSQPNLIEKDCVEEYITNIPQLSEQLLILYREGAFTPAERFEIRYIKQPR